MSTNATFPQATHTLTIIGQQEPTTEHLKVLHDGYLTDLIRAIKQGTIPDRQSFQKMLGLMDELKIWKTITLGLQQTVNLYRQALVLNAGNKINDYAGQILDKMSVSPTAVELDLVMLSVADLGFKKGATLRQIYDRAQELGLALCPAEVGPALRLAYQGQTYGEWLRIAMEPVSDSDGCLDVFAVAHDFGARWLDTRWSDPDGVWGPDGLWVFVLPRK